jgi:Tol biopolymer transport system component
MAAGGWSGAASISGDGHFVAFISSATNLGAGAGNTAVYSHDMWGGSTTLVAQSGGGIGGIAIDTPAVSFDGRYTAWCQSNSIYGWFTLVLVFDRTTAITSLGSSATGGPPNSSCLRPSLSDDGRFLAFSSDASNFVANDMNGRTDVFVADLQAGSTERVSAAPGGLDADGDAYDGRVSADGRYVVFSSLADNVVSNDTNGGLGVGIDVFIRDRQLATTERVSLTDSGAQSDNGSNSSMPCVSADGRLIAFSSSAASLVTGDTNGFEDLFLRDRGAPPPVIYCTAKTNSLGCVPAIGYSGLPSLSGPDNFYVTASNVLSNKSGMMLWAGAQGSIPFHGGILCLTPPIVRTPLQNSGGNTGPTDCSGTYSYHFTLAYMSAEFLSTGSTVCCQFWSRDPGFPIPTNRIGLTDALQFVIGP